jgi:hypothetical protein
MREDPTIIRMNIAHYEALLKHDKMSDATRTDVERLLAEANRNLTLAMMARGHPA